MPFRRELADGAGRIGMCRQNAVWGNQKTPRRTLHFYQCRTRNHPLYIEYQISTYTDAKAKIRTRDAQTIFHLLFHAATSRSSRRASYGSW